jgi:hypothetical protein
MRIREMDVPAQRPDRRRIDSYITDGLVFLGEPGMFDQFPLAVQFVISSDRVMSLCG